MNQTTQKSYDDTVQELRNTLAEFGRYTFDVQTAQENLTRLRTRIETLNNQAQTLQRGLSSEPVAAAPTAVAAPRRGRKPKVARQEAIAIPQQPARRGRKAKNSHADEAAAVAN